MVISMENFLEYKDYHGTVEYSAQYKTLFGRIVGINGLYTYEGESLEQLQKDFEKMVDYYISICNEIGISPKPVYNGTFEVKISPLLHKDLSILASMREKTLNDLVEEAIKQYLK